ncbi:nucleolar protein 56-like [Uloborus diversus]|uniref:nucleolar protein 56-like n=1 Tax=Uloborus diversus TaxID=327109 RepID=UPI00240917D9|nr:nucleolar protein 56-like [Uloborus diversus]
MARLYVLFEHAAGYALFLVNEFDEKQLPQIQKSIADISKFRSIVDLVSFQPFKTGRDALENMNSISEGILHPQLQVFLESNVPKSKKKHPVTLGVADSKIAAAVTESLGFSCLISGVVPEILRGIRFHFHKLVKGFKDLHAANKTQLGLGHHYSRARVKFNVNRIDNMIIQTINIVDQLDKDINTFAMRVREWYSHHFPELIRVVPENHLYVKCVRVINDRKNMSENVEEELEKILMDSAKVHDIMELARSSMGMEISPLDMENVTVFAERISSLMEKRKQLVEYLKSKMHSVAPNLATLIGDMVGARLIAQAGSLINLAKFPASTVQILGAEKALFRALKTRGNTPKYGLIYHSTFIGRAGKTNKGRISRYLASKCSIASRIDCFRDVPTEKFGEKLRQQVEDRLKFYDTGEIPAKNCDVMKDALEEAEVVQEEELKKIKKAKKKEKKKKMLEMENSVLNSTTEFSLISNESANDEQDTLNDDELSSKEKKKAKKAKKRKLEEMEQNSMDNSSADLSGHLNNHDESIEEEEMDEETRKRLKKEKKRAKKLKLQQMENSLHSDASNNVDSSAISNHDSSHVSVKDNEDLDEAEIKRIKKEKKKAKKRAALMMES